MRWRIYYQDGSTYSDVDGPVEHAPCDGVQAIVQRDATVGREVLALKHFYAWDVDRWRGLGDQVGGGDAGYGLFVYLRRPGWKKIVAGETVDYAVYSRCKHAADTDPDFPPKSALLPTEVRR